MNVTPLESRFDTYQYYRQAVADLIALAQRELVIFDPDLGETGLESRAGIDNLTRFLNAHRDNTLRAVLHEPGRVERNCPRLMALLKLRGHCISFRQSPEDLRRLTDCFMAADRRHALVRFHADHARGKLLIEQPDDVGGWWKRFDALWEISSPSLSGTTLGI
ncbi:MAG: hypothetical protein H6R12_785 [Proteobacteria bacterium]|nr:hypothetical protein [Pseudomonadota bacterium]